MNARKLLLALPLLLLLLGAAAWWAAEPDATTEHAQGSPTTGLPRTPGAGEGGGSGARTAKGAPTRTRRQRWEAQGTVLAFDDDEPVEHATVAVHRPASAERHDWMEALARPPAETARTDAHGRFALSCPPAAWVLVVATAEGFSPASVVAPRDASEDLEITLQRGTADTFVVTDAGDRIIAGAEVLVYSDVSADAPAAVLVSDARGRVDLVLGEFQAVRVSARGFTPRTIGDPLAITDRRIVLSVAPPQRRITGDVLTRDSEPVAGALVVAGLSRTRTDGRGRFVLDAVSTLTEELYVHADGFATGRKRLSPDPDQSAYRVRLDSAVSVSGDVVLPDGSPAARATVRIDDREVETGGNGTYRVDGLAPNRTFEAFATLRTIEGAEYDGRARVDLGTRGITGLRVVLGTPGTSYLVLRLRMPDGEPAVDLAVAAQGAYGRTGEHGRVVLASSQPAGSWVGYSVAPPNEPGAPFRQQGRTETISRDDAVGELVRLRAPVPLEVRVLDPSGRALGAEHAPSVHVWGVPGTRIIGKPEPHVLQLEIAAPDEGSLHCVVRARGYTSVTMRDLDPPAPGEALEVRMRPGGVLRGRVLDADGTPQASNVRATSSDGQLEQSGWVRAGKDGRFRLEPAPTGLVRVVAGRDIGSESVREVSVSEGQTVDVGDLRLPAPVRVSGRVLDAAGAPVHRARVAQAHRAGAFHFRSRLTDEDGHFTLELATPPGSMLVVSAAELGAATVELLPGRAELGDIVLGREGRVRVRLPRRAGAHHVLVGRPGSVFRWRPQSRSEGRKLLLLGLPTGPLEVFCTSGASEISEEVRVAPGKVPELDFEGR